MNVKPRDLMIYLAAPLLIVAMLFLMSAGGSVSSTAGYEWYFNPNKEHRQPDVIADVPLDDHVFYCGSAARKAVTITFDAGYENGYTGSILDTLKEKGVSAAFFLDGNYLKRNGALVQRMAAEGHVIGNHTLNHADMTALTDLATYSAQVTGWDALLRALNIEPSGYFRFPCGKFSERALEYNRRLGLTSVFWSFAYYDWAQNEQPEPNAALEKIMSRMHNGCVLLLHSTSETNAKILPELIDRLRADGYEILSLSEIHQN